MKNSLTSSNCCNHIQISDQIASARVRLRNKLMAFDVHSSGISEYNQRYISKKIREIESILQKYGYLINICLRDVSCSLKQFTLIDYGGGSGVLSFLAKETGIGTIIYNDISDISCSDVKLLSNTFGLHLDHIVCGDIDDLVSYLQINSLSADAIISYDVLEHIYDVEHHFKMLSTLCDSRFRIVYGSGANIKNLRYTHTVKKMQKNAECKDRKRKWGHKERDSLRAFLDVRKEMISDYAPELSSDQVEKLGRLTRGLIQSDIEKCVDEYRQKGKIDYVPDHPTNTCDPYTGNWSEHLIKHKWLKRILTDNGFSVEILPGSYRTTKSLLKKYAKFFLNTVIRLLGKKSMFIASYYILHAEYNAKKSNTPTSLKRVRITDNCNY